MKKRNILICVDRDGCLIYDNHYFVGSQTDWKKKIKILPHVISGLKLIHKKLPQAKIYIATNQTGIAFKDRPLLTESRAKEVHDHLLKLFKKKGVTFSGYKACKYVSPQYVKEHPEHEYIKSLVKEHSCRKPNPGMIKQALKSARFKPSETSIYMLGDRLTDVQTALNIKGFGIITPFSNRPKEPSKVRKLKNKNTYVSKNFKDACEMIVKRES